jgi:hypothetical protein
MLCDEFAVQGAAERARSLTSMVGGEPKNKFRVEPVRPIPMQLSSSVENRPSWGRRDDTTARISASLSDVNRETRDQDYAGHNDSHGHEYRYQASG